MKAKDISAGLEAIDEAIDFISHNTDSDVTGNGEQLIAGLSSLKKLLSDYRYKMYFNNAKRRLKRKPANP